MKKKPIDSYRIVLGDPDRAESLAGELKDKYRIVDFDQRTLYAETVSSRQLQEELELLPVFSDKRLVVVRNIEAFDKSAWEGIFAYLEKPYPHVCLFLTGQGSRVPLRKYAPLVFREKKAPEAEIFSQAYRGSRLDVDRVLKLFHDFLETKEKAFPFLLSAVETYLRTRVVSDRKKVSELKSKFSRLHELDFSLKVGQLSPAVGLELFLAYLFD